MNLQRTHQNIIVIYFQASSPRKHVLSPQRHVPQHRNEPPRPMDIYHLHEAEIALTPL
jgi:hypothetical protein